MTDPYGGDDWGYPPLTTSGQIVTVSHDHPHHANLAAVEGEPRVVQYPGEYEIRGTMIWALRTRQRAVQSQTGPAPKNTSFVIKMDDLVICHLGDVGQPLESEQLAQMKECSVLLVPVGGSRTLSASEAAELVAQVEPRYVVPMHYATPETAGSLALEDVAHFCKEMGAAEAQTLPRLTATPSSLPNEPTVVLLEQRR